VLAGLGQFFLCRNVDCRTITEPCNWWRCSENVRACPNCGIRYHPFSEDTINGKPPIDAQFALVLDADTTQRFNAGQASTSATPSGDMNADFKILLIRWPETAEYNLMSQMMLINANLSSTPSDLASKAILQLSERPRENWHYARISSLNGYGKLMWDNDCGRKKPWKHLKDIVTEIPFIQVPVNSLACILSADEVVAMWGDVNGDQQGSKI
jgi:hypothetical protein